VLSTVVRHTAWLDDPRLCAALARSDFSMADLKRQPMTVYLAIPPDRLRACLGFVRGFIGWPFRHMRAESAAKESQQNQTFIVPGSSYQIDLTYESAF
jgi:type IV secretory pathway TraG/TraD family ATPase VirD4